MSEDNSAFWRYNYKISRPVFHQQLKNETTITLLIASNDAIRLHNPLSLSKD